MARVAFTPEELAAVDDVCRELDPAKHELTAGYIDAIDDPSERRHVIAHLRRALRAELIVGLVMRAGADACVSHGVVDADAAEHFVADDYDKPRTGITGTRRLREARRWQYNLGYLSNEAIVTYRILRRHYSRGPGRDGLYPEDRPFFALLDLANDRMFDSLEQEHRRLLRFADSIEAPED